MAGVLEPNKTKIAKRVFEIFEFFCDNGQKATVMDIVRRYGRPQSSTSELMTSLVEMGLLYKDPRSRSYTPTPRIAALGTSAQPKLIRDGGLFNLMDRLSYISGEHVALFGMVGTHVQIFRMSHGFESAADRIAYGVSEQLSSSTAGLLLLSALAPDYVARMLWRINAEAELDRKFNIKDLRGRIEGYRRQRCAVGTLGFGSDLQVAATLLPRTQIRRPLAMGVIISADSQLSTKSLIAEMNEGIAQCAVTPAVECYSSAKELYKMAV